MSPTPSASPTPGDRADRPDPSGQVDHPGHDHSVASDCDDAIAELYAFLDGELDDRVMLQVETHLRRVIAAKCTEQVTPEVRARFCGLLHELSSGGADGASGVTAPSDGS